MKALPRQLLEILADGQFHSGEELGKILGITRSAIWKIINHLMTYGIAINSVRGRGYQIPQGLELLDPIKIQQSLNEDAKQKISALEIFSTVNSTNQYLLDRARNGAKSGSACLAEYQTAGKARHGRHWHSPYAASLYFSLLWNFAKDPAEISGLSSAVGVAVARGLKNYGVHQNIGLKWPNDVFWAQRKLAGILIETIAESHDRTQVVIGIGLNTNMPRGINIPIDQPWIDIQEITRTRPARNQLIGLLLNELIAVLSEFETKGFAPFLSEWQTLDVTMNKEVNILSLEQTIKGIVTGITEKGELLITDTENKIRKYLSGEVSLRLAK